MCVHLCLPTNELSDGEVADENIWKGSFEIHCESDVPQPHAVGAHL